MGIDVFEVDYNNGSITTPYNYIELSFPQGKNMACTVFKKDLTYIETVYFDVSSSTTSLEAKLTEYRETEGYRIIVLYLKDRNLYISNDFYLQLTLSWGMSSGLKISGNLWKDVLTKFIFVGQNSVSYPSGKYYIDYDGYGSWIFFVKDEVLYPCMNFYRIDTNPNIGTLNRKYYKPIKTVTVSSSNTLSFGTINYVSGKKYNVTVKFRTRGNGDSTSSKCSSVGFIANRSDWTNTYSYIHGSATAYAERGHFVEWTYTFTASATESRSTALYFIINNGWANGYDNQTIDLYYYKMWDDDGNVYAEEGNTSQNIVTKWSDNTAISSEKTLVNTATTEKFLYSEVISPNYMTENATYTIDFFAKISGDVKSVDLYFLSSDYSTTGFITAKANLPVTTDYLHFTHTFKLVKKSASSKLPTLRIRFDNNGVATSGNTGTLYVKNVKLRYGKIEKPIFLRKKDTYIYHRLYYYDNESEGENLKLQNTNYILKQPLDSLTFGTAGAKKYSELKDRVIRMEDV